MLGREHRGPARQRLHGTVGLAPSSRCPHQRQCVGHRDVSHVRPYEMGRRAMLGHQLLRPAGQRELGHGHERVLAPRLRCARQRQCNMRWVRAYVRPHDLGWREVLGHQRQRADRQREHHTAECAPVIRFAHQRELDSRWVRAHVCCDGLGRVEVLGLQQVWRARNRQHQHPRVAAHI